MMAGWLDDLTNWLQERLSELLAAIVEALSAFALAILTAILDGFAFLIEQIPAPEFLTTYSLTAIFSAGGPWVAFIIGQLRLGEAFALIAAGWAFRLIRKVLTVGQW